MFTSNRRSIKTIALSCIAGAMGGLGCSGPANDAESADRAGPIAQSAAALSTPAPRDFDGDGTSDVLWLNGTGAARYLSSMNGGSFSTATVSPTAAAGWRVMGVADFTGDGLADILWHNDQGETSIWPMAGGAPTQFLTLPSTVGSSWRIVGTGDFDGDGNQDILWHDDSGQVSIWLMDRTRPRDFTLTNITPATHWRVLDTGDFDGDGKSDILWGQTMPDGRLQTAVWLMSSSTVRQMGLSPLPSAEWSFTGTGDFDGEHGLHRVRQSQRHDHRLHLRNAARRRRAE